MVAFSIMPVVIKDSGESERQVVNLNNVLRCFPSKTERFKGKAVIEFSKEHWITVDLDFDTVTDLLKNYGKSR